MATDPILLYFLLLYNPMKWFHFLVLYLTIPLEGLQNWVDIGFKLNVLNQGFHFVLVVYKENQKIN